MIQQPPIELVQEAAEAILAEHGFAVALFSEASSRAAVERIWAAWVTREARTHQKEKH